MSWFTHDCKKHGHRYEGRFDSVFPSALIPANTASFKLGPGSVVPYERHYVCDVCVRCGDRIERKEDK